jgi:hypothetical protein
MNLLHPDPTLSDQPPDSRTLCLRPLRVHSADVAELDTENDDSEMHVSVLVQPL